MNKQDIIYKKIRDRVLSSMGEFTDDSKYIDEVTSYIIECSKIEKLLKALRYISLSKMWDSDEYYNHDTPDVVYWRNKTRFLQDKAEDAIMEMYNDE